MTNEEFAREAVKTMLAALDNYDYGDIDEAQEFIAHYAKLYGLSPVYRDWTMIGVAD